MALPAADSNAPSLAALRRLLAPFPGRGEMTLRMTVICVLTALVASAYGTPEAALSVYVVFFLLRPDRVTSAVLSAALLVLVTLVIGLILLVTQASIDYPVLRVSAMTLLSVGLLYLTSASKLRPVGAILAMIVGFGLDVMGSVPIGEISTRILLYAWLMAAIPVSIAIVVSVVLAPSPRRLACDRLARRLRLGSQRLTDAGAVAPEFDVVLHEGNKQILTWLKLSVLEGSSSRADAAALRQAAYSSIAVLGAIDVLQNGNGPGLPLALAQPLARTLDDMAGMLEQGGYPVDIVLELPPATALPPAARAAYEELCGAIASYAEPISDAVPAAGAKRGGFFLPDAGSNPEHIAYALKTTGAAMFCYLLYTLLDWPGIHTCFITCYIVSLGTSGETVQKLRLRLIGCLIGAAAGTAALVFLVPHMDSVGSLLALVGAASAVSAWIAVGPPRIAYAGFQIAFAFFLCVIQGPGPGFDLTVARDRTIGILLGNIVVYLVFTRIWPVSIGTRVDQALTTLRQQWHAVAVSGGPRHALAAEALTAGREAEQNLALTVHEPSWVRPDDAWRNSRRDALARLSAIAPPLILAAGRAPGDPALLARLTRAGTPGTYAPAPQPARQTEASLSALLQLMDARAARAAPAEPISPAKEPSAHAPA